MRNFKFVITEDKSVGLYSNEVNDIFHSKTGALKEAFDKFIIPSFLSNCIMQKNETNILDICYGIGYNTKAALSIIPNGYKLNIDCLEYSKEFVELSPFVHDALNRIDINFFLLSKIGFKNIDNILQNLSDVDFFNKDLLSFIKYLKKERYVYNPLIEENEFLHNIYYNYITNSMKQSLGLNKFNNVSLCYHYGDARQSIKALNKNYDIVFLDAFSPQKDPTLWTIDFLSLIKERMNNNSILVSYSKSTPFRSALKHLGFFVGKTFIDNIDMGTVASFNEDKIINKLSDYDIALLNTRSGIVYKDINLNASGKDILLQREIEQKTSNLVSHTQFLKKFSK